MTRIPGRGDPMYTHDRGLLLFCQTVEYTLSDEREEPTQEDKGTKVCG